MSKNRTVVVYADMLGTPRHIRITSDQSHMAEKIWKWMQEVMWSPEGQNSLPEFRANIGNWNFRFSSTDEKGVPLQRFDWIVAWGLDEDVSIQTDNYGAGLWIFASTVAQYLFVRKDIWDVY